MAQAASTSGSPLLKQIRKRQKPPGWFVRKVWRPVMAFSLLEFIFSAKRKPSPPRSIYLNQPLPQEFLDNKGRPLKTRQFTSNQNVTSKYTILTFVPRNLLEQFRRVANCFFLFINILQFFPEFSTINPGLVMLPLIVVLAITGLKDGYEDIKRHQADRAVNNSVVHILAGEGYENPNPMQTKTKTFVGRIPLPKIKSKKKRDAEARAKVEQNMANEGQADVPDTTTGPRSQGLERTQTQVSAWRDDPDAGDANELGWHRQTWEDLKVGDIVKLYDGEQFPADIVVLSTSEEEDVCYIETKNLDGETNLKSRHGVAGLSHVNSLEACKTARLRVDLDVPEVNMYKLNGAIVNMDAEGHDGEPAVCPITLETCLLRGCVLRNTSWVIGIVMFTGYDTKIIQNSGQTPSKRSRVERQMDPMVWLNLALLAVVAIVCALVNYFNERRWVQQVTYWTLYAGTWGRSISQNGIITFLNAFITFQNIVPISLYISIEFVRTIQAGYIYYDHYTKFIKDGNVTRTIARSWNLSDDLGQIEYIFSDKTGTLTQNVMVFRQCTIGGQVYGNSMPTDTGGHPVEPSDSGSSGAKTLSNRFHDSQLERDLEKHDTEQSRMLHGFFAVLGLCHTVLAAEMEPGVIEYKAQSPDEAALVQTAADVGFVFRGRDKNILRLSTPFSDEPDEYELLNILEFTSARKRMSVIVRKLDEEGRIFLLSKGADNVIFDHLIKDESQASLRTKTDKDLQYFASEGLRTLCLAYRVLDPKYYDQWAKDYHNATVALEDRETRIEEVSEQIEKELVLLGATAIEDKLQDGVPECISDLKRAGIKVWVATGDKLETAVAIGYTTHLLTNETNLIIVREGRHTIKDQLLDALEGFFGEHELAREISRTSIDSRPGLARINTGARSLAGEDNGKRPGGFSLVIEGGALTHAFAETDTHDLLLALSTRCNTVICCRVSPLQKAQIVRLIKNNLGVMCLAIGDGANDVSMIQAADVGVGISGEEGLQAVNSSDYAIAQFRYLRRLLFLHGHWSYFRNSGMILNFFYKNMIGVAVLFWFQPFCGFSTTYVLSYTYLLFWNVFWTLVPVLAIGLFDRNVDERTLMTVPELYGISRRSNYFTLKRFSYYLWEGVLQAAIIYFFLQYTYVTTSTRGDGWDVYIYEMSTTMAIAAVMVANLFTGLNIFTWVGWTYFGIALGIFLVWVYTAVFSSIPPSSFSTGVYGNQVFLFRSYAFWFGVIYATLLALLPRYIIRYCKQNYFPDDLDVMRLVRKFHPNADPQTHPLLGGKFHERTAKQTKSEDTPTQSSSSPDVIPMEPMEPVPSKMEEGEGKGPLAKKLFKSNSNVTSKMGRHPSARGSAVDMSTGLTREASRGFDFTMEEGGVAVQRMQSRLSNASSRRANRSLLGNSSLGPMTKSTSNPFGIAKIRERAGSVFSPKKRERRGTTATGASGLTDDDADIPPVPAMPATAPASSTGDAHPPLSATSVASPSKSLWGLGRHKGDKDKEANNAEGRRGTVGSAFSRGSASSGHEKPARRVEGNSIAGEGEEEELGRGFGTGRLGEPPMEPRV